MKFDFVIGNPPYQEERQGDSNTATPVYHTFMDEAYKISDRSMLITPARFLFNTGYTSKSWNEKKLNDPHFKVESYFPRSDMVFNGVDIKGGVAISYHDTTKSFRPIEVFTMYPLLNTIFRKVIERSDYIALTDIMVSSFAYHFTDKIYEEHPALIGRASAGHEHDLQSNIFETMPELFAYDPNSSSNLIRILGRENGKRCWKYTKRSYINTVENLDSFKVFLPKATGAGQFGEVLPEAIVGRPGDANTITFLSIGNFEDEKEVLNCIKYLKSKFARALIGVLKATQNASKSVYKMVPVQEFKVTSDIDWSKPIPDIDRQLYRKYNLSEDEIDFIESNVKEME